MIESEQYLLCCHRYMELNPVRGNRVKKPEEWKWSSYGANACGESNELIMPHEVCLAIDKDKKKRVDYYRANLNKFWSLHWLMIYVQQFKQVRLLEMTGLRKKLKIYWVCKLGATKEYNALKGTDPFSASIFDFCCNRPFCGIIVHGLSHFCFDVCCKTCFMAHLKPFRKWGGSFH